MREAGEGDEMIDKRDMDQRMCHTHLTHKGGVFDVVHQICNGWTMISNLVMLFLKWP